MQRNMCLLVTPCYLPLVARVQHLTLNILFLKASENLPGLRSICLLSHPSLSSQNGKLQPNDVVKSELDGTNEAPLWEDYKALSELFRN